MAERFYLNSPLSPGLVELTGPEAHHLATVRRLRPGDPLCLFNGDGHEYPARLVAAAKRAVTVEVVGRESPGRELAFSLEIAAPIPKGDRAQFLIEKLTELGVRRFVPLSCARSVIHPRHGKLDKFTRYVIEASKQCGRNVLMHIAPLESWAAYCRRGEPGELRLLAHPSGNSANRAWQTRGGQAVRGAVGPEGGFTDEEIQLGHDAGWRVLDLGPRILRIETAALALACMVIS